MKKDFEVQKILVPIDFSETSKVALRHAANLCEKFNAEMYLMHAVTTANFEVFPNLNIRSKFDDIREVAIAELNIMRNEIVEKHNIQVEIIIKDGRPANAIVDSGKEINADFIVMGTHGVSGFEEFFIGSNAYRVVTATDIPILTLQHYATKATYDNIFLPLDHSIHSIGKIAHAAYFAETFGATIHIAALISNEGKELIPQINMKVKQAEDYFENRGIKFKSETIEGNDDVATMTINQSEKVKADLIFIMSGQQVSTGLFMGPYAQRIVNHSKIPVVSITPREIIPSFTKTFMGGNYRF